MLKISLKDLRAAPHQRLGLHINEILSQRDPRLTKPIVGEIVLSGNTIRVTLQGQVKTIVKLQCHTCLNYFFQAFDLQIAEEFVYEDYLSVEALSAKDRELQSEDFFETVSYYGDIDVLDVIYQAVSLAIPAYCSCGAQCSGPPVYNVKSDQGSKSAQTPGPGKATEGEWVDPRWHNLKTILPKDNKNGK